MARSWGTFLALALCSYVTTFAPPTRRQITRLCPHDVLRCFLAPHDVLRCFLAPHDVLQCFLPHTMYFTVFCSTRCTSVIWRTLASAAGDVQGPHPRRRRRDRERHRHLRHRRDRRRRAARAVKSIQLVTSIVGTQIVCVAAPPHANRSSRAHRRQRDELPLPQRGMDGDKHRRRAER